MSNHRTRAPENQRPRSEDQRPKTQDQRPKSISFRAILLSLLLAALFGWVNPLIDFKFSNTYLGAMHMPPGALGALMLLLGFNALLMRLAPRWKWRREELLTVFITGLFSALVPGRGGEVFFIPNLVGSFYFATPENKWLGFLSEHLKPWFTPALSAGGQKAVQDFYNGGASVPWALWLGPVLCWSALIFALYVMLACLAIMLRAQWTQHEALAFPLLKLPLEMTENSPQEGGVPFWKNSLTWIGFGIAVCVQGLNGLNLYFPEVPVVPLALDSRAYFSEPPWNQMGPVVFRVLPIVVGVSYLLSSEVALSFWVFYLLHKTEYALAYQIGFPPASLPDPVWTRGFAKTFISYQQIGAFWAYAILVLWIGRAHLIHVFHRATKRAAPREGEAQEPLSYPVAFWGFVAASLFILSWTVAAGVRADVAFLVWLTYLVIALGLTRVVVEGGLLYVNHGWSPLLPLAHLTGAGPGQWLSPSSAVPMAVVQNALMVDLKGMLLPSFLHAFKLAGEQKLPLRPLLALIFACIVVAFSVGVYRCLDIAYSAGGLQMNSFWAQGGPQEPPKTAKEIIGGVQDNFVANWFWLGTGALTTWGLTLARMRFLWFPFHPLGYLMWSPFVMYAMWFSIFLGWFAKAMILRFGGADTYRRVMPAFLGLALGDVSLFLLWNAVDAWQGRTAHQLMPG